MELVSAKLETLHFWAKVSCSNCSSEETYIPTLAAIRSHESFTTLRDSLVKTRCDMNRFLEEELNLIDPTSGWTIQSLTTLFNKEYIEPSISLPPCQICEARMEDFTPESFMPFQSLLWDQWVLRIKYEKDLQAPLPNKFFLNDMRSILMRTWKEHSICGYCQEECMFQKGEEEERLREEESIEEGSMFLPNFNL